MFFFFNDTATTEIYTLSLHDALPISRWAAAYDKRTGEVALDLAPQFETAEALATRSEEHTSELQSQSNLVCRLLLEKKKNKQQPQTSPCPAQPRTARPHTPHNAATCT